jgi:hypothetical protein
MRDACTASARLRCLSCSGSRLDGPCCPGTSALWAPLLHRAEPGCVRDACAAAARLGCLSCSGSRPDGPCCSGTSALWAPLLHRAEPGCVRDACAAAARLGCLSCSGSRPHGPCCPGTSALWAPLIHRAGADRAGRAQGRRSGGAAGAVRALLQPGPPAAVVARHRDHAKQRRGHGPHAAAGPQAGGEHV